MVDEQTSPSKEGFVNTSGSIITLKDLVYGFNQKSQSFRGGVATGSAFASGGNPGPPIQNFKYMKFLWEEKSDSRLIEELSTGRDFATRNTVMMEDISKHYDEMKAVQLNLPSLLQSIERLTNTLINRRDYHPSQTSSEIAKYIKSK